MAKYVERNKSASGDREPKTINVTDDQNYEYRKDRGYVTIKYYFHGKAWQDWAELMAVKDMKGAQMSFFLGARFDQANKTILVRGSFQFAVWMDRYAKRFDGYKFVLASDKGVKLGIPADDDELIYFINGMEIADIIREADQRQAQLDADRVMREMSQ